MGTGSAFHSQCEDLVEKQVPFKEVNPSLFDTRQFKHQT